MSGAYDRNAWVDMEFELCVEWIKDDDHRERLERAVRAMVQRAEAAAFAKGHQLANAQNQTLRNRVLERMLPE